MITKNEYARVGMSGGSEMVRDQLRLCSFWKSLLRQLDQLSSLNTTAKSVLVTTTYYDVIESAL